MKKYDASTIFDAPLADVAQMLDSCLRMFTDHGRDLAELLPPLATADDYAEALAWLSDMFPET